MGIDECALRERISVVRCVVNPIVVTRIQLDFSRISDAQEFHDPPKTVIIGTKAIVAKSADVEQTVVCHPFQVLS
jgi:hypothetical protein